MIYAFTPTAASGRIAYADDSTDVSVSAPGANALLIVNPDSANVVAVSAGFTDGEVDAIVPTSDFNGSGVVVGPGQQMVMALPGATYHAGNIFISVAGDSATGNVFITPGVI